MYVEGITVTQEMKAPRTHLDTSDDPVQVQTISSPMQSGTVQDLLLSLVQCGHHAYDLLPPVDHELALLHQFV